jgi:photosystem II stability/assembly factor-like uncharacterized protein
VAAVLASGWIVVQAAGRAAAAPQAISFDPALFSELKWRNIGPFRGGRTKAVDGIASQPNVFYIGAVDGGVWKTNDFGRTWAPIFDDQPTGSVGAIAIAPSNPNIVYVGSGEGMQRPDLSTGDGIYKSTDAGKTWTHLALRDGQQIPQLIVDPKNPDRVFVAVLGHPYGPNPERGIFRSVNGGRTFEKILYRDDNTGGVDLAFDPVDPNVVYAVLLESRQGPWENSVWTGPGSGLYKSTDGGTTWRPLTQGLPTFADGLGRMGITVAPSDRTRLYAVVDARALSGIYRSNDAGETWARVSADTNVVGRPADAADIRVHPTNPDIVFVPSVVTWKSTDGGRTFTGFRGAPGGDDYQKIWINPLQPETMILTSDQGAIVSVNGGQTWGSWYNQPTAAFYHVSADNAFPYRVCGGQQDSGSACIASRGDRGQITMREWLPVGVEEYGYVAPDPQDPDIVYGGKVSRFDRRTGQVSQVPPPRDASTRTLRTMPLVFSPFDPHTLFFATNTLWKANTAGAIAWTQISHDLTRETWEQPATIGAYRTAASAQPTQRGVIYAVAPSSVDPNVIWAGTDDGVIQVTRNGGTNWTNVSPPQLVPWAKVSLIEASHFDPNTAYAAIDTLRLDDMRPHVYRTRDGGRTWSEIVRGLPDGAIIRTVREDPQRRGLLFAGSERSVSVSFDDGESWQSLKLNMPATSIRDLVLKDSDLVAGTHGRGFWILDDISPLRQITADITRAPVYLFSPPTAWRFRWNKNTDTPLPPDEPAAPNPPDGVVISYLLTTTPKSPVVLEIIDPATGDTVRRYASDDPPEVPVEGRNIPDYWIRPPQRLAATPGLHRFVWNVRYPPPAVDAFTYPISAVVRNTPQSPEGILVAPGTFQVRLTVDGQSFRRAVVVRMDPRVKTSTADLTQQFTLSRSVNEALKRVARARADVKERLGRASDDVLALRQMQTALDAAYGPLPGLLDALQDADVKPPPALQAAVDVAVKQALDAVAKAGG